MPLFHMPCVMGHMDTDKAGNYVVLCCSIRKATARYTVAMKCMSGPVQENGYLSL